jgi:hypothetical protein
MLRAGLTFHDDCCGFRHPHPAVHTTLSTIQVLLFARLLAERIASKGRPNLSQMINLLPTEVQLNLTDFGGERVSLWQKSESYLRSIC